MIDGEVPDLEPELSYAVEPDIDELEQTSWGVEDAQADGLADGVTNIVEGGAQLAHGVGDVVAEGLQGAGEALHGLGEFVSNVLQDLGSGDADQAAEPMPVPESDVLAEGVTPEPVEPVSPPPVVPPTEPAGPEATEQGDTAAPPGPSEPTQEELAEAVEESGKNADLLSDLSTMRHQTAMNMINNIR
jgi:hypothetical protein